ncbi:hypothetical protein LUZ61_014995 [Rhynchospora tenuis]|uniref:F-box domain-containing protein n=1 Tax=Rhynchospora tenuis TaxID=198213 RepID=A0AAD5WBZ3_9POAL|nr:hypothetical protein LUZ61_014995 [Rhynchospora tenuis]
MGKPTRDWHDLPPEILHLICEKLPDIYDFTVFHSVCKTWRSIECDPPPQLPWILEHRTISDDPALRCYSLTSDKIHTITCPRSCGKCFLGPCYNYLLAYRVTKDGYSWSLLNPLTSNEVMNIATQKLVYEVPPIVRSRYDWQFWMVKSEEEILQLRKKWGLNLDDLHFDIYRLDLGSGKQRACWVKIDNIGDQVLFLDEHRGVSFCASDYEGLGENCIYFLENFSSVNMT